MRVVNRIARFSSKFFECGVRHAERNGVERRRVRSDENQLTCKHYRLVPMSCHLFLYQAVPFSSVVGVLFPKFSA